MKDRLYVVIQNRKLERIKGEEKYSRIVIMNYGKAIALN